MNEFEILKEAILKFDFDNYDKMITSIERIIDMYSNFFLGNYHDNYDNYEVKRIVAKDEKGIEVEVECSTYCMGEYDSCIRYITMPLELVTNENKLKEAIQKKKEKEEKEAREKLLSAVKEAEEREYKNYLRLKEKFETKGE